MKIKFNLCDYMHANTLLTKSENILKSIINVEFFLHFLITFSSIHDSDIQYVSISPFPFTLIVPRDRIPISGFCFLNNTAARFEQCI